MCQDTSSRKYSSFCLGTYLYSLTHFFHVLHYEKMFMVFKISGPDVAIVISENMISTLLSCTTKVINLSTIILVGSYQSCTGRDTPKSIKAILKLRKRNTWNVTGKPAYLRSKPTFLKKVFKASALWANAFYKSKCPYVCLFMCVFTFEVPFKRLFAPIS